MKKWNPVKRDEFLEFGCGGHDVYITHPHIKGGLGEGYLLSYVLSYIPTLKSETLWFSSYKLLQWYPLPLGNRLLTFISNQCFHVINRASKGHHLIDLDCLKPREKWGRVLKSILLKHDTLFTPFHSLLVFLAVFWFSLGIYYIQLILTTCS